MFSYFIPWSSSSPTSTQPTPNEKLLARLKATGAEAFADQEALMQSWSINPPSSNMHAEIITILAQNITHRETSLTYKILCTLWISKLDPQNGHGNRAASIHDLLNSGDLDSESSHLFKAFAHDLSMEQWVNVELKLNSGFKTNRMPDSDENAQAFIILGAAYQHLPEASKNQILNRLYVQLMNPLGNIQEAIGESMSLIFNSFDDQLEIDENDVRNMIITHCIAAGSKSEAGLLALARIVPHATKEQQETILHATLAGFNKGGEFYPRAVINTMCACFMYAGDRQNSIVCDLVTLLTHHSNDVRPAAADGLYKIYTMSTAYQKMIIASLEQALLTPTGPATHIANLLNRIDYAKSERIIAVIDKTLQHIPNVALWRSNAPAAAPKITTSDALMTMPQADSGKLDKHIEKSTNKTVKDQVISFCAQTFKDVIVDKTTSPSMRRK